MQSIRINGGPVRTYYDGWHEVSLAEAMRVAQEEDPTYELTGIDWQLLDLEPLPELTYEPHTLEVAKLPFGKYANAIALLKAGQYYQAVQVYYPEAKDNATEIGKLLAVMDGVAAYQKLWQPVLDLPTGPKVRGSDKLEGFGLYPILYDVSQGNVQVMKQNEHESADTIMQAYALQHVRAHVQWLNAPKQK